MVLKTSKKNKIKICFFGIYDPNYGRNRVLIEGFEKNNTEVIKCNDRVPGFRKYLNLAKKYCRLDKNYDILLVAFPGWPVMWLAKILTRKPIIYDAFLSVYESQVEDRKKYSPKSLKAKYYWFLDWLSCKLADRILLDTDEHIKYFVKTFKIKKDKFIKVLVGTDDGVFFPRRKKKGTEFLIHFHGSFIPLQGIQYIIKAAKKLEKHPGIQFSIIGKGQTYSEIRDLAQKLNVVNVNFLDYVPYKELPNYIARADICLGIFGDTEKAKRVIPNKVYEAIAMKKPVISADTPAARELFTNRKNILFCRAADPEDLAKKILELKNNPVLGKRIAESAHRLFSRKATPKILGKKLKSILQILMKI